MKKYYVKRMAECFPMPMVMNVLSTSLSLYEENEFIGYEDLDEI